MLELFSPKVYPGTIKCYFNTNKRELDSEEAEMGPVAFFGSWLSNSRLHCAAASVEGQQCQRETMAMSAAFAVESRLSQGDLIHTFYRLGLVGSQHGVFISNSHVFTVVLIH
jgi:hypothetical protein